jgi:hypothetical protein
MRIVIPGGSGHVGTILATAFHADRNRARSQEPPCRSAETARVWVQGRVSGLGRYRQGPLPRMASDARRRALGRDLNAPIRRQLS